MTRYEIGGVSLDRWEPQNGTAWFAQVTVERPSVRLPGRHGAVPVGEATFAPALDVLQLFVECPVDGTLEEEVGALVALFTQPVLELSRVSEVGTTTATARLVSLVPGDYLAGEWAFYTATITRDEPFWRGAQWTSPLRSPAPAALALEGLAESTAPVVDAVLRFTGPLSQVTVTDAATSTGLSWVGSLASGQYLYLDAGRLTARRTLSSTAWTSGGSDVSGGLDYPTAGPLQLIATTTPAQGEQPDVRAMEAQVAVVGAGTGTAVMVRARGAHH